MKRANGATGWTRTNVMLLTGQPPSRLGDRGMCVYSLRLSHRGQRFLGLSSSELPHHYVWSYSPISGRLLPLPCSFQRSLSFSVWHDDCAQTSSGSDPASGGRCCRHNARSHPVIMQGSRRGYYAYTRRRALSFSLLDNACTSQQIIPVYWALVDADTLNARSDARLSSPRQSTRWRQVRSYVQSRRERILAESAGRAIRTGWSHAMC